MQLVIPGEMPAKKRHRCRCHRNKPSAYDSQLMETINKRADLKKLISSQNLGETVLNHYFSRYLSITVSFHVSMPNSCSNSQKNEKLWGFEFPTQADLDNRLKFLCDLGNGILWKDDAQIVKIKANQIYSETPCTNIEIFNIVNDMNDDVKKVSKIFSPAELSTLADHLRILKAKLDSVDISDKLFCEIACEELIEFSKDYANKFSKLAKK